jgi:hypothetical protein
VYFFCFVALRALSTRSVLCFVLLAWEVMGKRWILRARFARRAFVGFYV